MKVSELQQFIKSLAAVVSASGGHKVASDLERVSAEMEPFQSLTIAEFGDFLVAAENYRRDGILPTKGGRTARGAKAVNDTAVKEIAQTILALYERATDPNLQYSTIESEIKKLDKQVNKDEAVALAREVGIARSLKSKKEALEQIKLMISTRKESFERTKFRSEEAART